MAEFTYKSRIYGDYTFTVDDAGGIVSVKGRQLAEFGGYLQGADTSRALRASAETLEQAARRWWQQRVEHLDRFGHQANGVKP